MADDASTVAARAEAAPAASVADSGDQTVEDTWQLSMTPASSDPELQRFRSKVLATCTEILRQYGGPDAFLRARFGTPQELQGWVDFLDTLQNNELGPLVSDGSLPISNVHELSEAGCDTYT